MRKGSGFRLQYSGRILLLRVLGQSIEEKKEKAGAESYNELCQAR